MSALHVWRRGLARATATVDDDRRTSQSVPDVGIHGRDAENAKRRATGKPWLCLPTSTWKAAVLALHLANSQEFLSPAASIQMAQLQRRREKCDGEGTTARKVLQEVVSTQSFTTHSSWIPSESGKHQARNRHRSNSSRATGTCPLGKHEARRSKSK